MKHSLAKSVFILSLFTIAFFACKPSTTNHKVGLVKQDTIIGVYIISPYGSLMGGPVIRTISYKENVTTKDSITFTKSVTLDTTCQVFIQQPFIDSVTKKQKTDSIGQPLFKTVSYTLPGKFVEERHIPTH